SASRIGGRRGLARRSVRSRYGLALRALDHRAVRGGHHRRKSKRNELPLHARIETLDRRTSRPATLQAALRPHYGNRSQSRRTSLDGSEWRRSEKSPGDQASESASARKSGTPGAGSDEDAAVYR